jgi:hypothetical protein
VKPARRNPINHFIYFEIIIEDIRHGMSDMWSRTPGMAGISRSPMHGGPAVMLRPRPRRSCRRERSAEKKGAECIIHGEDGKFRVYDSLGRCLDSSRDIRRGPFLPEGILRTSARVLAPFR